MLGALCCGAAGYSWVGCMDCWGSEKPGMATGADLKDAVGLLPCGTRAEPACKLNDAVAALPGTELKDVVVVTKPLPPPVGAPIVTPPWPYRAAGPPITMALPARLRVVQVPAEARLYPKEQRMQGAAQ